MSTDARRSALKSLKGVEKDGFTLTEILVALSLMGLAMSSTFWALTTANQNSFAGRLHTGAITAAQNQIDLILSDMPFNPQNGATEIPPELTIGTQTKTDVPIYLDPVPRKDPVTGDDYYFTVNGTMTTTVANTNTMRNGYNLNIYRATVTITYTYRKRNYSVVMNTMRAPDI